MIVVPYNRHSGNRAAVIRNLEIPDLRCAHLEVTVPRS